MPGFGSTSDADGKFAVDLLSVTVLTEDGDERPVNNADLMKDFRFSASTPSIKYMFDPEGGVVASEGVPPSVKAWLSRRATDLVGGPAKSVTFKWCPTFVQVSDATESPSSDCRQTVVSL